MHNVNKIMMTLKLNKVGLKSKIYVSLLKHCLAILNKVKYILKEYLLSTKVVYMYPQAKALQY